MNTEDKQLWCDEFGEKAELDFCVGKTDIIKKTIATVKLGLNYGAVMFAVKMSTLQGWFDFHFKNFI